MKNHQVTAQTERLQASEAELRASLKGVHELQIALDEHAIVAITDPQGKITFVNDKFCTISKYSRDELLGRDHRIINSGHHPKEFMQDMWTTIVHGKVWRGEIMNRAKDGTTYWVASTIVPFLDEQGKPLKYISIRAEITERKRAEAELLATRNQLQHLLEHSPAVIYSLKVEGERVLPRIVSNNITRLLGFTVNESSSYDWWEAHLHPDDRERAIAGVFESVKQGCSHTEYRIQNKEGNYVWVQDDRRLVRDDEGKPADIVGVWTDITERKRTEKQLLRAQRLESIGTLAGGIAHDLNNSLAPILMATEILRMQYPDAKELINTVHESAQRGANMVKQLLTFAKGVEGQRLLIQPGHLLRDMEKIINVSFPKSIQLRTSYSPNLHVILGDPTQLHQVVLNLCVNARDAMPDGGILTMKAENLEIDATFASTIPEAKAGHYFVCHISDTGTGIPKEILDRIFEPFFTTKGPDKGTGLGLSTVIGIIKSHSGFIRVDSTVEQGSTFSIYLPAAGSGKNDTSLLTKEEIAFRGAGETILVVDDEVAVREIARAVLSRLNFHVVTAANGTEALMQVAQKRAELSAVITDMHMPHMDGLRFVRVLKHVLPEVKIIVTSGNFDEWEMGEFKTLGVDALLHKPFTQEKLVEALKAIRIDQVPVARGSSSASTTTP